MSNVVREDVVQISFDVINNPCQEIANEYQEMKNTIAQAVSGSENSLSDLASSTQSLTSDVASGANEAAKSVAEIGDSCNEVTSAAQDAISEIDGFEDAKKGASDFADTVHKLADKSFSDMTKAVEETKDALGSAKDEGAEFVTKLKDIGKTDTIRGLENIKNAANETQEGFEDAGDSGVNAFSSIADILAAVGITVTLKGIIDAAYGMAEAFSEAESIIVQATGATGDALDSLNTSMMNAYSISKSGTLNDTAAVVGELNTRLGYTGEALENTTSLFLDFSTATGANAASSVRSVTQLMNQWGVAGSEMESTLNKLTYAGQASGINVDTLSSELMNNKAILDELGFSMDEATAMFMNFELAGTNTSQVLMGFRTALSSGAISSLDDLRIVFNKLTDGTMSAEEAAKMFGSRAGVTIKNAAQMGVFSLDEIVGALNNTDGLLLETAENAQTMKQKWEQSTKGITAAFTTALQPAFEKITDCLTGLLSSFGGFLKEHPAVVKGITAIIAALGVFASGKIITSAISNIGSLGAKFGGIGKTLKGFGGSGGDNAMDGFLAPFKSLAKAKPTTILKGIANLAIIVGGLTVLAIALMALAPYVAKLTDIKSIMKLIAIIGVLGVVGSALAVMAGFVGNIPVSSVALGLANIAIIVAGMSALFLLIGAVSLLDFDYNKILEIVKIIAILGAVGSVLSVFAGIVGLIPIPIVLAGLANIALVLAGLTAIIVAFGALSEIPGFNDFIAKGGETLAQLFGVIGNIVGSLIGGVGEGISNSLPKIGENLSAFAEALKPMFEIFNGADMGGIGSFFSAIGGFMLMMTGNDILSFFTGGIDFAGIGNDLTSFANNAEGFFTKIATFPDNSFTNAAALFQSLADIGNIPCTGGIAQWFTGTIDFNGLAEGLKQLASDDVLAFFTKMAGLPTEGFENTKALFQSLADIGNIPCTGGLAQWFSGTLDFDGLTQKLPPFGTAMAEFFTAIAPINDFEKIKSLFEALGGLEDAIPNSGGIAQWFTGENDISGVGESLKKFGNDTKDFFAQVNGLDVGKLNGLWDTIKKAGEAATTNLSGLAGKGTELTNFMNNAKGFFSGAGEVTAQIEAVNSVALALQNFFGVIATIVDTSLTNINTGLQTTVALIQASTGYFNSFGIAIMVSCNSGATAFIFLQTTITTSVDGMRVTVTSGFAVMASTIKRKCSEINATVSNTASRLKSAFNGINLTSVGANIVQGLLNGMKSKSTGLLSYVNQLAQSISKTMRTVLDEHSPSKVMYQIGEFAVQGLVNGIVDTTPKAQKSADSLAQTYTPEDDSAIYNNSSSTQNTTYAPVFNLTISGSNSDRELARKIRSWVRDEVNNINESMLRRSEPAQII